MVFSIFQKRPHFFLDLPADGKNTQAITELELKTWVSTGNLVPQPPNTKLPFPNIGIMKQHDPSLTHLGQP